MGNSVVLYDGDCPFCNSIITYIKTKQKNKSIVYLPSKKSKKLLEKYKIKEISSVIYIQRNSAIYYKSDALFKISKKLRFPFNLFGIFRFIPKSILDYIYDFIAKRRMKIIEKKCCDV